jgi:2,4-dichlorophenol 6-monooxygenase
MVLKGQAGERLLDSYNDERAPIAKQIVTRANQSIAEFGPIFEALGMGEGVDPVQMYITIAGMSYFYLSNQHTLSAIFGRSLLTPRAKKERLAHMIDVTLSYLERR